MMRRACRVACVAFVISAVSVVAQNRLAEEKRREQWQRVGDIFAALRIHAGATVADVGAGDGFFTSRLARAVGPEGRVFAVDIDDKALARLRERLEDDGVKNVTIVKGTTDDPKLPDGALDAALIVNAYHEMPQRQLILAAIRRALKPEGRLVIVEPIRDSRRGRPRVDQVRNHEIEPEFVLQDARAAGFRIVGLEDPFTARKDDVEWMLSLQLADSFNATFPTAAPDIQSQSDELKDASLRMSLDAFKPLADTGTVAIVDVRDEDSFTEGHIPGALSIPLDTVASAVGRLREIGKPIVTYCS